MNFSQLSFGTFSLKIFGLLFALIFLISTRLYYKKIVKEGLSENFFVKHFWRWIFSGIILGRFFSMLIDFDVFYRHGYFAFLAFYDGGINFFGFFLGAMICAVYDFRFTKNSIWQWLDLALFPITIAVIGVDIISFITGEIYFILFFSADFLLQFLRADETMYVFNIFRISQIMDLFFILIFIGSLFKLNKKEGKYF